jgi:hypothetical protein
MSIIRHINAEQTTLYKKADINLETYPKHTKTPGINQTQPKERIKPTFNQKKCAEEEHTNTKRTKKGTVQQKNKKIIS